MSNRNDTSNTGGFFHEKSGGGATFVSILLVILLVLGLIGMFSVYAVTSIFEQRGLQRAMEAFLQDDEIRSGVAETIQNTFPDDVITDAQVDELVNDKTILKAASRYVYDAIHLSTDGSGDFYDNVLNSLDDPSSAALYSDALDRFTEILGVDDDSYRKAMESVAENRQITLPAGETDKLALTKPILRAAIDERRGDLPQVNNGPLTGKNSRYADLFSMAQKVIRLFETPKFLLFNLLILAVWYGLILLLKRSYRKPFLYCCIPYFLVALMMLAGNGILSAAMSSLSESGSRGGAAVTGIASGALLRSAIIAFCIAAPLLIAFIALTELKRKRAARKNASDLSSANVFHDILPPNLDPPGAASPAGDDDATMPWGTDHTSP